MATYVELQVVSHFSFLRGASSPDELFAAAALMGYGAIGVADFDSVAGAVRCWEAQKATDVRHLPGSRVTLRDGRTLLLYPTDQPVWSRLTRLLTIGKGRAGKGGCDLDWDDLRAHAEGLVAILLPEAPGETLERDLADLRASFGKNAFLGLTLRRRPGDMERLHALAARARQARVRTVALGDVLYHAPDARLMQDVMTAIRERTTIDRLGFRRERHADRHLKSPEEMERRFAAFPDAIQATADIAARCTFHLGKLSYQYPHERVIDGISPQQALAQLTDAAAARMFPDGVPLPHQRQIAHEMRLIEQLGYAPYFLTVNSIVAESRRRGILCQGRGSAANSCVCFVLGITSIDPIQHELLFERFVSGERREPPDIDVDFEHERREEIIQWIYETYAMIRKADTLGVFQIESRAQMSMLPRMKPTRFYDLVIEVAIVRPGPIQGDMVHPYLRRREGKEVPEYPRPELRAVLEKTLGVPLFQEQAMRVAIVGAGFTAVEADQLRRAMATFKFTGGVSHFYDKLVEGMVSRGYPRAFAERTFKQIEGFGSYGFPESHAASFAKIAYASSWMKHHHPDVFCAALLNAQPMGFYAPAQIVDDAKKHGVRVLPVCVNASRWDCTLEETGKDIRAVRLGLRQVRGLANLHGAAIVAARGERPFSAVEDVWRQARVPRAAIERLAEADAFHAFGDDRRHGLWKVHGLGEAPLPLFAAAEAREAAFQPEAHEPATALRPMTDGREVVEDYRSTQLSLGENWGSNTSFGSTVSHSSGANGGSSSNGFSDSAGASEGSNLNVGRSRGSGSSSNTSQGWSEQLGFLIEPAEFGRMLRTGGPANGFRTSAIWYQAGRTFARSGGPMLLAEFQQS